MAGRTPLLIERTLKRWLKVCHKVGPGSGRRPLSGTKLFHDFLVKAFHHPAASVNEDGLQRMRKIIKFLTKNPSLVK